MSFQGLVGQWEEHKTVSRKTQILSPWTITLSLHLASGESRLSSLYFGFFIYTTEAPESLNFFSKVSGLCRGATRGHCGGGARENKILSTVSSREFSLMPISLTGLYILQTKIFLLLKTWTFDNHWTTLIYYCLPGLRFWDSGTFIIFVCISFVVCLFFFLLMPL